MNQNFKEDIEDLKSRFETKINEIRYSKEYLDLKDSFETTAETAKKLVMEDLKSNGIHFGRLIKKAVRKKSFRQLLTVK